MSTKVAVEVPIKRSQSEKDDSGVIVEEYYYERALDVGVGLITVAKKSNSSSCPIGPFGLKATPFGFADREKKVPMSPEFVDERRAWV